MERKFKVGDRVEFIGNDNPRGKVGIVKQVRMCNYAVEFYNFTNGHDCYGVCSEKKGWFCEDRELKRFKNETIVIYRKGDEVIALDKSSGEKAVAKCDPRDTFDFKIGARIAFDRLLADTKVAPEPVKTPLNTKIVFTDGDDTFKTGHIYEIVDGYIYVDGRKLPERWGVFHTIDDVIDYFTANGIRDGRIGWSFKTLEFIEVKED